MILLMKIRNSKYNKYPLFRSLIIKRNQNNYTKVRIPNDYTFDLLNVTDYHAPYFLPLFICELGQQTSPFNPYQNFNNPPYKNDIYSLPSLDHQIYLISHLRQHILKPFTHNELCSLPNSLLLFWLNFNCYILYNSPQCIYGFMPTVSRNARDNVIELRQLRLKRLLTTEQRSE